MSVTFPQYAAQVIDKLDNAYERSRDALTSAESFEADAAAFAAAALASETAADASATAAAIDETAAAADAVATAASAAAAQASEVAAAASESSAATAATGATDSATNSAAYEAAALAAKDAAETAAAAADQEAGSADFKTWSSAEESTAVDLNMYNSGIAFLATGRFKLALSPPTTTAASMQILKNGGISTVLIGGVLYDPVAKITINLGATASIPLHHPYKIPVSGIVHGDFSILTLLGTNDPVTDQVGLYYMARVYEELPGTSANYPFYLFVRSKIDVTAYDDYTGVRFKAGTAGGNWSTDYSYASLRRTEIEQIVGG